jgi:hypothetical protein
MTPFDKCVANSAWWIQTRVTRVAYYVRKWTDRILDRFFDQGLYNLMSHIGKWAMYRSKERVQKKFNEVARRY